MKTEYKIAITISIFIIGTIVAYLSPNVTDHAKLISISVQKMEINQLEKQVLNLENKNSLKNIALNSEKPSVTDANILNTNYESENSNYDYMYKKLDWSDWRSNFLNRILDDCDYIPSLNNYRFGTWMWISFNVLNTREISNVIVFSPFMKYEDRKNVEKLIKSYAHRRITIFPQNSKRKSVNVRFILILDNSERRSRPEDFHDREKIKI